MIENIGAYSQVDYDRGYQQGRADRYQEIISEYMLLTEKQVAEIRADAIDDAICEIQEAEMMEAEKLIVISILEQLKEQNNE